MSRCSFVALATVVALSVGIAPPADAASTCPDVASCLSSARTHAQNAAAESQAADADLARAQALAATTTTTATTSTTVPATTSSGPTTTTTIPQTGTGPVGVAGSWHPIFADEFTATSLDRTKWNTFGSWERDNAGRSNVGNGELDYKTDGDNFSFANGAITIQARREAWNGLAWTSGQLGSKQAFTFGYIETRAQFASPKGFLNAFWTWGAPGTNAPAQETDAYEFYSDNHTKIYLTSHAGSGGGCQGVTLGFDPTAGMHVYGADIEQSHTDFYIDGVLKCGVAGAPSQAWNIVDYMTVNASSRAPIADASTTHAEYIIDYVRAFAH